jgi:hypothetical protein
MTAQNSIWDRVENMADRTAPEAGIRQLMVRKWEMDETDPTNPIYILDFQDLENEAYFSVRYWLKGKSEASVKGTLKSLKKAIFGEDCLVPVEDIKGAVVLGEVTINNDGYARIYKYLPAPKEVVEENSEMEDQYYIGRENE